jgi:hypothetical protein
MSKPTIWKVSHGKNSFTSEERDQCLAENLAVVHGKTGRRQGEAFKATMQAGDIIYLCHGNDGGIKVLGKIDSEAGEYPEGEGWLQRKYGVLRESLKPKEKYTGPRRGWSPNYNSTCFDVPDDELELFENAILKPFFGTTLGDIGVDSRPLEDDIRAVIDLPLNTIFYGPPGTGKTWKLRKVAEQFGKERCEFVTFHQSYSYEDFVEGIKPKMGAAGGQLEYEIKKGLFRDIVERAQEDADGRYAIFIDEISRGNVASIFGELIALIEEDKRLGAANELSMKLPYSRKWFGVPANLYIIGAMNTADRSVEALDAALRRRFAFVEMPPDSSQIELPKGMAVDLRRLLDTINGRIERLLDKDHRIGHSYFMGLASAEHPFLELQEVFNTQVLPLLGEHFYGDPAKIGMVLGPRFVKARETGVELARGDWPQEESDEQLWDVADPLELEEDDFISVYDPDA